MKPPLIISACLLGIPCRYDGASKPIPQIEMLSRHFQLIPICPEVDGGLSTPRPPCEILLGRVIRQDGTEATPFYLKGAKIALETAKAQGAKAALLKEKSPSCGSQWIYDGTFQKKPIQGEGVTARILRTNGIAVFSEDRVDDLLSFYKINKY